MKAQQKPGVGQALHVAAHGLHGHVQAQGQAFDRHGASRAHFLQQRDLARIGGPVLFHGARGGSFLGGNGACHGRQGKRKKATIMKINALA